MPTTRRGKGDGGRSVRLEEAVREELAGMIARELKDPRIAAARMVGITRVEINRDLSVARVGISIVSVDARQTAGVMQALEHAAGFLRGEIGRRLQLRHAPELRFVHDRGVEHAAQIDSLLKGGDGGGGDGGGKPGSGEP